MPSLFASRQAVRIVHCMHKPGTSDNFMGNRGARWVGNKILIICNEFVLCMSNT